MHDFTPIPALIGGAIIGLAASLLLLTHGKVAGISGLYGSLLRQGTSDRARVSAVYFHNGPDWVYVGNLLMTKSSRACKTRRPVRGLQSCACALPPQRVSSP